MGFVHRNWYGTETHTEGGTERQYHLASGVPPKGLELRVNFWRYRGFDAGKKGMVRCIDKEYGSILNRRKWFDAGSKGMV